MLLVSLFAGSFMSLVTPVCCAGRIPTNELVQLMDKKGWTTATFVGELVAERGKEAIPPLIDILQHGDDVARDSAMMAIRKLKDPRAIPVLIDLLAYKHSRKGGGWLTAVSASRTLEEFGGEVVEPLLKVLEGENENARRMAVRSLRDIDDEQAIQALQEVFSNRDDPHWKDAARYLAEKEGDVGYSVFGLAEEDEELWDVISRKRIGHRKDKRFMPFYFERARSDNEGTSRDGMLGIARNAGKAEFPRIFAEGLDKTWLLPMVGVNAAIKDIEPESVKADILWRLVISPTYWIQDRVYNHYDPHDDKSPVRYAIERLAALGDVVLPLVEGGIEAMWSKETEIGRRAIAVLLHMPPSEAATDMMLKALDIALGVGAQGKSMGDEVMSDMPLKVGVGELIKLLGERKEKRVVRMLVPLLDSPFEFMGAPYVAYASVRALNDIGDRESLEPLLKRSLKVQEENQAETDPKRIIAAAAMVAESLNHWKVADASFIPLLVQAAPSRQHGDGRYGALYYRKRAVFLTFVRIGIPSIEALEGLAKSDHGDRMSYGDKVTRELAETALKIIQYDSE